MLRESRVSQNYSAQSTPGRRMAGRLFQVLEDGLEGRSPANESLRSLSSLLQTI